MNPDDDDYDDDDQLLLSLMEQAQDAENENPGRGAHTLPAIVGPRHQEESFLDEWLSKPVPTLHIPTVGSSWRNKRTLRLQKVIHITEGAARILVTLDDGKPALPLTDFQVSYEKYTPSTKAGGGEPVEGEEWQNIHTSLKASILEIKQGRKHMEVRYSSQSKEKVDTMPSFLSNWKRIKGVGKWHVGALKGILQNATEIQDH